MDPYNSPRFKLRKLHNWYIYFLYFTYFLYFFIKWNRRHLCDLSKVRLLLKKYYKKGYKKAFLFSLREFCVYNVVFYAKAITSWLHMYFVFFLKIYHWMCSEISTQITHNWVWVFYSYSAPNMPKIYSSQLKTQIKVLKMLKYPGFTKVTKRVTKLPRELPKNSNPGFC